MFTFLGTSAGEQFPGVWCNCHNCQRARQWGGRNIRRNSCAAVGDRTLIDFGPAIPIQAEAAGISLPQVETLLVTHAHEDHWHPWYLMWRRFPAEQTATPQGHEFGPLFTKPPHLTIYGNEAVLQSVERVLGDDFSDYHLSVEMVFPWKRYETKDLAFIPIPANHDPKQSCFNYIIEYEGRSILYASDTGWFLPETQEFLKQFCFDLVVMEGTFGFNDSYDVSAPGHLNFHANRRAHRWMQENSMLQDDCVFAITHTGPHHAQPYDVAAPILDSWGLTLAYDGMQVDMS